MLGLFARDVEDMSNSVIRVGTAAGTINALLAMSRDIPKAPPWLLIVLRLRCTRVLPQQGSSQRLLEQRGPFVPWHIGNVVVWKSPFQPVSVRTNVL